MTAAETYSRARSRPKVIETIAALHQRICERFPGAGLGGVCAELLSVAEENSARAEQIARRNMPLRVGIFVLLLVGGGRLLAWIVSLFVPGLRARQRTSTRCCRASRRPPTCSC